MDSTFLFSPLSPAAQELIVAGGAEKIVASRLRAKTEFFTTEHAENRDKYTSFPILCGLRDLCGELLKVAGSCGLESRR
jgi:hypothetical protein